MVVKLSVVSCVVIFVKWPVVICVVTVVKWPNVACVVINAKWPNVTCVVTVEKWHWQVMSLCWSLIQLACRDVKALGQNGAKGPLGSSSATNTAIEGAWNWR